jgi:indole-3-glycerol phosphate synthase
MSILADIFAHKRLEVERRKQRTPLGALRAAAEQSPRPPVFWPALEGRGAPRAGRPGLIAEIKRRSPSRGPLAPGLDPVRLASIYQQNGAAALSVLTDGRYFGGSLDDLRRVSGMPGGLPVLRKDFICDPYQLYEARLAGAAAVLLIVAGLELERLAGLHDLALSLDLAPLVEVHTRDELRAALDCGPRLVGINNRDLRDFSVHLETSLELRPHVPAGIAVVAESGIHTRSDIDRLAGCGFTAILVGEALVTAPDVPARVREFAGLA